MHPRLLSVLPHTVMLGVSALLYYAAMQIDAPVSLSATRIGPDTWPKFIIVTMAGLCLYEIIKRLLIGTSFTATGLAQGLNRAPQAADRELAAAPPAQHNGKLAAGIALIAGFVFGVVYLGFFVATVLFLAGFAWIGGFRRPLVVATTSLVGGFVLLIIFMRVAYISLPLGAGPFKDLSLLLLKLIGVS
jgi:putative tricarboxylic transport membrane protein